MIELKKWADRFENTRKVMKDICVNEVSMTFTMPEVIELINMCNTMLELERIQGHECNRN